MVRSIVVDEAVSARSVDVQVVNLDTNGDGVLSHVELWCTLKSFRLLSFAKFRSSTSVPLPIKVVTLYDSVVEQFYVDCSGTVDRTDFQGKDNLHHWMGNIKENPDMPIKLAWRESKRGARERKWVA
jgi:hypothetical protein